MAKRSLRPNDTRASDALEASKKEIESAGKRASRHLEQNVTKRLAVFENKDFRRLIATWIALFMIVFVGLMIQTRSLNNVSQKVAAVEGGTYIEGVLGDINNINPVYAQTLGDRTVSSLLFDGLFGYDETGKIEPRLADSYELNEEGDILTVTLQDDIFWHDGDQFDAADVVFTYNLIKHPDSGSPLSNDWQDVTIQAKDDYTVTFALPNPYTPFIHALTNGIVPAHLLSDIPPVQMRTAKFNVQPVGTGPFEFSQIIVDGEQSRVELLKSESHFGGTPSVDEFIVVGYETEEDLKEALLGGDLTAAFGLQAGAIEEIDTDNLAETVFPTSSGVFLFMNNQRPGLDNVHVRRGIAQGIDRTAFNPLLGDSGILIEAPLLQSQLTYDDSLAQLRYDLESSIARFKDNDWELDDTDQIRKNGEVSLEFELVTQDTDEFIRVAEEIKKQLAVAGVKVNINAVSGDIIQQNHVIPHNYDMLLFGIELGADPDVFVYWHSSQTGRGGFNFSDYESEEVDAALESGRTRSNVEIRQAKYESFLKEWRSDAPAVALFQDNVVYVTLSSVKGVEPVKLNNPSQRLHNVVEWTLNTKSVENLR